MSSFFPVTNTRLAFPPIYASVSGSADQLIYICPRKLSLLGVRVSESEKQLAPATKNAVLVRR